jgi:putative acyl-CoA dehydrogenase
LESELPELIRNEGQARRLTEKLALMLQGSLLLRYAPAAVADAFIVTRLGDGWSGQFGDLPPAVDAAALARRAVPVIN